ncbi:hypothetical protein TWF281_003831 [Arthrobotrys megalospora]
MDESMVKEFESVGHTSRRKGKPTGGGSSGDKDENDKIYGPFDFRHLKLVEHKRHLMRFLQGTGSGGKKGGKVVITSDKSLEWGFSTEVIKTIADDERNLIVLTEKGSGEGTAGAYLYKKWREICLSGTKSKVEEIGDANIMGKVVKLDNVLLDMNIGLKVPLNQQELTTHNEFLKQQQLTAEVRDAEAQLLETAEAAEVNDDDVDDVSSSSDEEDEDEDSTLQGKSLASTALAGGRKLAGGVVVDEGVNVLVKGKGVHDWDVRGAKGRNRMFPFVVQRRKYDDYGEVVRAEDFVRAEEVEVVATSNARTGEKIEFLGGRGGGVVINGVNVDGGDAESGIGRKRKWDKVGAGSSSSSAFGGAGAQGRRGSSHVSKKMKHGRGRGRDRSVSAEPSDDGAISESSEESDEYEPEEVGSSAVCKLVINTTTVNMKNSVVYVDYEALHDGRSLRMLLPQLKPKKVVLVAGDEEETSVLFKEVEGMMEKERRKILGNNSIDEGEREVEVFMPKVGEMVNVGGNTDVWSVKLSDGLIKMLKWQSVGGLGVVHVVGRVMEVTDDGDVKEEVKEEDVKMEGEEEVERKKQLVLDVLPSTASGGGRTAKPIHVGDVKLAELRRVLLDAGHTAELTGEGRLLCDGVVSVVKEGVGRVTIEDVGGSGGLLSGGGGRRKGRFWEVRKWVYEGLARVAGA